MPALRDVGTIKRLFLPALRTRKTAAEIIGLARGRRVNLSKLAEIVKGANIPDRDKLHLLRVLGGREAARQGALPASLSSLRALRSRIGDQTMRNRADKIIANVGPRKEVKTAKPLPEVAPAATPRGARPGPAATTAATSAILRRLHEQGRLLTPAQQRMQTQALAEAEAKSAAGGGKVRTLALLGGGLLGGRVLFGGDKQDSRAQTRALMASLLLNQDQRPNTQGLVDARVEKLKLETAILLQKLLKMADEAAPGRIPFS